MEMTIGMQKICEIVKLLGLGITTVRAREFGRFLFVDIFFGITQTAPLQMKLRLRLYADARIENVAILTCRPNSLERS